MKKHAKYIVETCHKKEDNGFEYFQWVYCFTWNEAKIYAKNERKKYFTRKDIFVFIKERKKGKNNG